MPVVPFSRSPSGPTLPKADPTFLMMAAAELHEAGRLVEPPKSNLGPEDRRHPPEWRGNKQYKEIFEGLDKAMDIEKKTGVPASMRMHSTPILNFDEGNIG